MSLRHEIGPKLETIHDALSEVRKLLVQRGEPVVTPKYRWASKNESGEMVYSPEFAQLDHANVWASYLHGMRTDSVLQVLDWHEAQEQRMHLPGDTGAARPTIRGNPVLSVDELARSDFPYPPHVPTVRHAEGDAADRAALLEEVRKIVREEMDKRAFWPLPEDSSKPNVPQTPYEISRGGTTDARGIDVSPMPTGSP